MPRELTSIPNVTIPTIAIGTDRLGTSFEIKYRVITPMLGGGAEPGIPDSGGFRVRAPSVRGQLRFWWRATAGARRYETVEALREAEAIFWGSTAGPGKVRIRQEIVDEGRNLTAGERQALPNPNYPLFPIYPDRRASVIHEQVVRLWIRLDTSAATRMAEANDVVRTLSAWLMFGGVGGRWRRGLGSVELLGPTPFLQQPGAHGDLEEVTRIGTDNDGHFLCDYWNICGLADGQIVRGWPQLYNHREWTPLLRSMPGGVTAVDAVVDLIEDLREYRQEGTCSEFVGQHFGDGWAIGPGTSRMPSGLIMRIVRIGALWYKMIIPMRMTLARRDRAGRDHDAGIADALDFFYRELRYR